MNSVNNYVLVKQFLRSVRFQFDNHSEFVLNYFSLSITILINSQQISNKWVSKYNTFFLDY